MDAVVDQNSHGRYHGKGSNNGADIKPHIEHLLEVLVLSNSFEERIESLRIPIQ
jgi:hypothetical protein